jgi:hypothetical protein
MLCLIDTLVSQVPMHVVSPSYLVATSGRTERSCIVSETVFAHVVRASGNISAVLQLMCCGLAVKYMGKSTLLCKRHKSSKADEVAKFGATLRMFNVMYNFSWTTIACAIARTPQMQPK